MLWSQCSHTLVNTMQRDHVGLFGMMGMEKVDGQQDPFPSKCWQSQLSFQWGECS